MTPSPEQELAEAEQRVTDLQKTLKERLTVFDKIPRGDERTAELAGLVSAAEEVRDAEDVARAAQQRLRRVEIEAARDAATRTVRYLGLIPVAVAVVGVLLAVVGFFSLWWLFLLIPLLIASVAVAFVPIASVLAAIRVRKTCARAGIGAAVLTILAVFPWPQTSITVVLTTLAGFIVIVNAVVVAREYFTARSTAGEGDE